MLKEISLRIIVKNPVSGTVYGLQKGKGAVNETVQAQSGNGKDLIFDLKVEVKKADDSGLKLTGPFVQGPAGNRFIYIGIGSYARQAAGVLSGRLKIPLPENTFKNAQSDHAWYCEVPGSGKDGKPVFATVKPFGGWFKSEHSEQKED